MTVRRRKPEPRAVIRCRAIGHRGEYSLGGNRMRYVIKERLFRLGEDSDIMDESGQRVLQVDGKVLSLRDLLIIRDPAGNEVARVQRKLIALRPTYEISAGGQELAEVRKKLFTPFGDQFTIDVPGPD